MIITYFSSSSLTEAAEEQSIFDQNTAYINEHKEYVQKAYSWLKANCPEIFSKIEENRFQELIANHDASKFSEEEFEPYAHKWFGDGKKTPEYEAAWEHHWKNNKHHPEYWEGKDMPRLYVLEMLCDWLSFGLKKDDPGELIDYYETKAKDDPEKNFSEKTKTQIEEYLEIVKVKIDKD